MAAEDFFPMESLLEVSLVEGGQQINPSDDIQEVTEDPVTDLVTPEDSRTETASEMDDIVELVSQSAIDSELVEDRSKSPSLSVVNGDIVQEENYLSDSSSVTELGVKSRPSVLSAVNIAATQVSEEERAFYKEFFQVPGLLTTFRLHCTVCDRHIDLSAKTVVFMHRILRVLLCWKCFGFYGSGEFQQGEDGSDMFCRWCGQGGRLLCCSACSNVFCEKCILRNFGGIELRKIKKADEWNCFVCNLRSLWPARAKCAEMKNVVTQLKRKATVAKMRDGQAPVCVDESRCCSSKFTSVKTMKSVTSEEQKKPLAMIQPLPKKKVFANSGVWDASAAGEQNSPGYVTIPTTQTLGTSHSLLRQSQPFVSRVQRPQVPLQSPPVTPRFTYTKAYERIRQINPAHKSVVPIRISNSLVNPLYSNTNSQTYVAPTAQTRVTYSSPANRFQSNINNRFIKVVSTGQSTHQPVLQSRYKQVWSTSAPQQQYMPIQPKPALQSPRMATPLAQQPQYGGVSPSFQVVEPTIQLPNPRLLAPNQVYTVPASYIQNVFQSGAGHTQIPAHVLRPVSIPDCPPLLPFRRETSKTKVTVREQPKKTADRNKVKTKWFVSGVEKFAGVSRVLWTHIHKLNQTFANMEGKNDVQGMKATARKLHHLLEKAAEHMKEIDKTFGKEFYGWCKNLKTQPPQQNVTPPEVIDITDEDNQPITLVDDTPAEVIEVEISPDIVSLGKFSSSADDGQYTDEGSESSNSFARDNKSTDLDCTQNTHHSAVVNAALDHAYSATEPAKSPDVTDESNVTLDLDISCESDEDNGNTADESRASKCDDGDVWMDVEYDSDDSLSDKLSGAMDNKQAPCVDDHVKLNEVTGEIEPNYDSVLQTSPNPVPNSMLNKLLQGKVTVTKIGSADVSSSTCKEKSVGSARIGEQNTACKVPKKCSISVQTDVNVGAVSKKCEATGSKNAVSEESLDETESQKPVKPWSNEFDSFLKKLNLRSVHAHPCSSESATAPASPASQPSVVPLPRQVTVVEDDDSAHSENQHGPKKPGNKSLPKCIVKLEKVAFPDNSSCVAPDTVASVRVRMKKEKVDYVDTDSAVSKVLRSERRSTLHETRNSPAPDSVRRKRRTKSIDFEQVAKKIKCGVDLDSKYSEISRKMCVVKVERLKNE